MEEQAGQEKMKQLPVISCVNAPPFHIGTSLADNSNADNVAGSSNVTVLNSSRHIAAVSAVAGVLGAAAVASAATAAQAEAVSAPAAAATIGRAVLCLDHHVHPIHGVCLFSCFLCGSPRCSCLLPGSYHRPKGLQQALGYRQISSSNLTQSPPPGSSQPPHHSTQNYAFLQKDSKEREIEGKFHK